MYRTSDARARSAVAMILGLTAGGAIARPVQADAAFAPAVHYPVGNGPVGVTVADVDGDGAPDVISANSQGGDLSLLINNGDGTLAPEVRLGLVLAHRRASRAKALNQGVQVSAPAGIVEGFAVFAFVFALVLSGSIPAPVAA